MQSPDESTGNTDVLEDMPETWCRACAIPSGLSPRIVLSCGRAHVHMA